MSNAPWKEVPVEPLLVGIEAATVILGVGERRIKALIASGRLHAVALGPERLGRGPARYLLSKAELESVAAEALAGGRL